MLALCCNRLLSGFARSGCKSLGGAVDDLAVLLDETLDEPMLLTLAACSSVDASLAQVVITVVANTAVEVVSVRHRLIAVVAEHLPSSTDSRWVSLTHQAAELVSKSGIHIGELVEERIAALAGCDRGSCSFIHLFSRGLGVCRFLSLRTWALSQESSSELQLLLGLSSTIELLIR